MTEQQQTFLELYRKYESILREQGLDYFTVSEQAEDSVKNKMNLMRQMRNFLVHTDSASFVSISQEQLVFLEQLITMQSKCGDTLKKHLVTMRKCSKSLSSSVFDAIALLLKYDFFHLVLVDENGRFYGLATLRHLTKAYLKNMDSTCADLMKRQLMLDVVFAKPDVLMTELLQQYPKCTVVIATKDGTKKSEVLGMCKLSQFEVE